MPVSKVTGTRPGISICPGAGPTVEGRLFLPNGREAGCAGSGGRRSYTRPPRPASRLHQGHGEVQYHVHTWNLFDPDYPKEITHPRDRGTGQGGIEKLDRMQRKKEEPIWTFPEDKILKVRKVGTRAIAAHRRRIRRRRRNKFARRSRQINRRK